MYRLALVLLLALSIASPGIAQTIRAEAIAQIEALIQEKQSRTRRSKSSTRICSTRRARVRVVPRVTRGPHLPFVDAFIAAEVAPDQTVQVNIRATVSEDLTNFIQSLGGREVAAFPRFDTVTARLPLDALLTLAARPDVRFIAPLEKAMTNRYVPGNGDAGTTAKTGEAVSPKIGSVTSQGVVAHGADKAHATGITGTGRSVCVLSDGIDSAAARQATGDLPSPLNVLPGQAGSGDEGTAMLEIVYDVAPGAQLGYATALGGIAQMATNILNLRSAGCAVIVDDITYFAEPAFQDGPIAQAIASVQSSGALYFSSSANSGNLTKGTSGTWEGDWTASGVLFDGSPAQRFGATPYNVLTKRGSAIALQWSDPLGASSNDYDLYVLDPTGTSIRQRIAQRPDGVSRSLGARRLLVHDVPGQRAGRRRTVFRSRTRAPTRYVSGNAFRCDVGQHLRPQRDAFAFGGCRERGDCRGRVVRRRGVESCRGLQLRWPSQALLQSEWDGDHAWQRSLCHERRSDAGKSRSRGSRRRCHDDARVHPVLRDVCRGTARRGARCGSVVRQSRRLGLDSQERIARFRPGHRGTGSRPRLGCRHRHGAGRRSCRAHATLGFEAVCACDHRCRAARRP